MISNDTNKSSRDREPNILVGFAVLLALITGLFVISYVSSAERSANAQRRLVLDTAARHASEMAEVVGHQMEAMITGIDLALLQLIEARRLRRGDVFEALVGTVMTALQDHGIQGVVVTDRDGRITYSSISSSQQGISLGDRDYFVAARKIPAQVVIGTPVRSRLLRSWSFVLARPIVSQGRFDGMVVIGLTPEYFAKRLVDPRLSAHDVIAVIHPDGSYLARNQLLGQVLGTRVPLDRPFLKPGNPPTGIYRVRAPVDGRERTYAWQRVAGSNLVVLIGLDEEDLLLPVEAENESSRMQVWSVAASLLFLGGGLSWLLWYSARQQRRLINSEALYRKAFAESHANERKLKLAASMFAHSHEGIFYCDPQGEILDVNDGFVQLTGYARSEAIGHDFRFLDAGRQGAEFYDEIWDSLQRDGNWQGEIVSRNKSGGVFVQLLNLSAIVDSEGGATAYVGIISDITSLKENERRFMQLAHTDALTGLPNRTLLIDRLNQAVRSAARQHELFAVAFIDLDGFKPINDRYGHQTGDEVLIEVSRRLRQSIRSADTACRLGGDEFIVVLRSLASHSEARGILDRMINEIGQPYLIGTEHLHGVSASAGLAFFPDDAADADDLISAADDAMYEAKRARKTEVGGGEARYPKPRR